MTCDDVRTALSARLDGELQPAAEAGVDAHLGRCPACRGWLARAEQVTRAVRLQVVDVPDLTPALLAAAAAPGRARERAARRQVLRLAVAVAAVVQLSLAVPVLLGGVGVVADPHVSREMASFDIAMAAGFVLAAWRPERAWAFLPIAFVLTTCLAVTTAIDVINANTAAVHELGHLAAVMQTGLLWALGRSSAPDRFAVPGAAASA